MRSTAFSCPLGPVGLGGQRAAGGGSPPVGGGEWWAVAGSGGDYGAEDVCAVGKDLELVAPVEQGRPGRVCGFNEQPGVLAAPSRGGDGLAEWLAASESAQDLEQGLHLTVCARSSQRQRRAT